MFKYSKSKLYHTVEIHYSEIESQLLEVVFRKLENLCPSLLLRNSTSLKSFFLYSIILANLLPIQLTFEMLHLSAKYKYFLLLMTTVIVCVCVLSFMPPVSDFYQEQTVKAEVLIRCD